jgi:HEPN domain-containing protein
MRRGHGPGHSTAHVWYRQAKHDLAVARFLVAHDQYDWSCLAAQQAAEKALKAACLAHGKSPPGIHELDEILADAPPRVRKAFYGQFDLVTLQAYATRARYPVRLGPNLRAPFETIASKDAADAVKTASRIVAASKGLLGAES